MHRTYHPAYKAPIGQNAYRRAIKAPVRLRPDIRHAYPPWFHFGVYQFVMRCNRDNRWYQEWMRRRGFVINPETQKFTREG